MSALLADHLDQVERELLQRPLLLSLDYDGTLVPIASQPQEAVLPPTTRDLIRCLARVTNVAIVSGRALSEIQKIVDLKELIYAGNHGFKIVSESFRYDVPVPEKWPETLLRVAERLKSVLSNIEGVLFEDKEITVCIHFRLVAPGQSEEVRKRVQETIQPDLDRQSVCVKGGKKVFEICPPVEWDKGKAIQYLLSRPALSGRYPLHIGDDETDEDAFRAIQSLGMGIRVGTNRLDGKAHYWVKDSAEVLLFLERLAHRLAPGSRGRADRS